MMDKKRSRSNGILYFLIGLPIGIAVAVIAIIFLQKSPQNDISMTECNGFDSPEEAVYAYVDHLKNGDVTGMISSFAIESFAGHFNLKNECDRTRMYSFQQYNGRQMLPGNDEFSKRLNIETRKNQLTYYIRRQYMQKLLYSDNSGKITPGTAIKLSDETDGDALTPKEVVHFLKHDPGFDRIKKVKVISPSDLKEHNSNFKDIKSFEDDIEDYNEQKEKIWDTDVIEHIIAEIYIEEEKYYLFMTVGCYDDKWYNMEFNNFYGTYLKVDSLHSGFIKEDELFYY